MFVEMILRKQIGWILLENLPIQWLRASILRKQEITNGTVPCIVKIEGFEPSPASCPCCWILPYCTKDRLPDKQLAHIWYISLCRSYSLFSPANLDESIVWWLNQSMPWPVSWAWNQLNRTHLCSHCQCKIYPLQSMFSSSFASCNRFARAHVLHANMVCRYHTCSVLNKAIPCRFVCSVKFLNTAIENSS